MQASPLQKRRVAQPLTHVRSRSPYQTLSAVRPNPAWQGARVMVELPEASAVQVRVFDLLGREVSRPLDEARAAGRYVVDLGVEHLPAGTYLVRMEAGTFSASQRLTVSR